MNIMKINYNENNHIQVNISEYLMLIIIKINKNEEINIIKYDNYNKFLNIE